MKILIINPNSTESITERICRAAESVCGAGMQIDVISSAQGPRVIETAWDELKAAGYVVEELLKREDEYDGAVIACASDPGLAAAKERLKIPVVGIFEAAAHVCLMFGSRFSVVGSCGEEDIGCFTDVAWRTGVGERLNSVKYISCGVAGVDENSIDRLDKAITSVRFEDGSDAVILGCAAFAGMAKSLSEKHGIYVADGISEAIYLVKMQIELKRAQNNEG